MTGGRQPRPILAGLLRAERSATSPRAAPLRVLVKKTSADSQFAYPAFCAFCAAILSNAALLRCSISAGVRSSLWVPIDQLWPKGSDKADTIRKKIVATKEGGHITGEERLREKASQLYGDLTSCEGRPADYLVARIDSLQHELDDVSSEFDAFTAKDLRQINESLVGKKLEAVQPLTRGEWATGQQWVLGRRPSRGARRETEKKKTPYYSVPYGPDP